jgi:sterol 24-C-methyltransferase
MESIKRAEYHLCSRLGLKPGMRALDVGCGVGGPMRNMAIFSGAKIDGITINQYQVRRGAVARRAGPIVLCVARVCGGSRQGP